MSRGFPEPIDLIKTQPSVDQQPVLYQRITSLERDGRPRIIRTDFKSSNVCNSGLKPPWMQRNCLFITAAKGNEQKLSIQASYTRSEYLCLHSNLNVK